MGLIGEQSLKMIILEIPSRKILIRQNFLGFVWSGNKDLKKILSEKNQKKCAIKKKDNRKFDEKKNLIDAYIEERSREKVLSENKLWRAFWPERKIHTTIIQEKNWRFVRMKILESEKVN